LLRKKGWKWIGFFLQLKCKHGSKRA
jgi:hypothetical protein